MIALPTTTTPEQFQKAAPLVIQHLLQTDNGFTDGVDQILSWKIDGSTISGQFLDKRPDGDRVFAYELQISGDSVSRSYWPVSGVKFEEYAWDDDPYYAEASYPDQDALDAAINALDDANYQEMVVGALQPVFDFMNNASDYTEVLGKLATLYPQMDSQELEQKLSRAIFVSEIWGRLNAG